MVKNIKRYKAKLTIKINKIFYTPIYFAYLKSDFKEDIQADLVFWTKTFNLKFKNTKDSLFYFFYNHKDFRNLFYYRTEPQSNILSRIYKPALFPILQNREIMEIKGGGCVFWHSFSTIINAKSIGKGCTFRNNTTIGNNKSNEFIPIIGDNVDVGSNVVIIGSINIGNNVIIGAGTVLTKSVPENSVVVGNPARIIKHDNLKCDINF